MTNLPAALRGRLSRRRLVPLWVHPESGQGARKSRSMGSGLEFENHRPYQPGDDLRHLDRHAFVRFRAPYVKRFATERGLTVTVLLDDSGSMSAFREKSRASKAIAGAAAYLALAAGDRLRLGRFASADDIRWYPIVRGLQRFAEVDRWLDLPGGGGSTDLHGVARRASGRIGRGLLLVISDWWHESASEAIRAFARAGTELVAVQVLSPQEEDPSAFVGNRSRVIDSETGEGLDVAWVDDAAVLYERALADQRAVLAKAVSDVRGRLQIVRSDADVASVVLLDWRRAGLVS